jgi:hypothetical protein
MLDVNAGKLLQIENNKWQDPTSRQRGRPTKAGQQLSENKLRTESNIWSQVPEWARYLDMTDWPPVIMWLWLDLDHSLSLLFANPYHSNGGDSTVAHMRCYGNVVHTSRTQIYYFFIDTFVSLAIPSLQLRLTTSLLILYFSILLHCCTHENGN